MNEQINLNQFMQTNKIKYTQMKASKHMRTYVRTTVDIS